jgi:hypothetical protein
MTSYTYFPSLDLSGLIDAEVDFLNWLIQRFGVRVLLCYMICPFVYSDSQCARIIAS